jgi:RNA polymerase sigma-70 factor (ECF subfamily)
LYDRFQGIVFRFLLHMTGNEATAEELTQDLFLRIIQGSEEGGVLANFDGQKGRLEGYLIGMARNLARRSLSQGQRWISLELAPELTYKPSLIEKLSSRSETERLRVAILGLPPAYREVVILCGLEEKSYEEAARILDRPVGTIASRLNRARLILARCLNDEADELHRRAVDLVETRGGYD